MEDVEPLDNKSYKTKHTRSTILSYRFGLDPIATSYPLGWIEKTRNIPGYIISNYITHHKKEPPNETAV